MATSGIWSGWDENGQPIYRPLQPGDPGYDASRRNNFGGEMPIGGGSGGLKIGDVLNAEQAAGLQRAGYKVVQVGQDLSTGGVTYQIVGLPPGQGQQGPFGEETTFGSTTTGSTSLDQETSRELPEDVRQRYTDLVDRLLGQKDFGFSPEELAGMQIGPEELQMLLHKSGLPVAGTANAARDELLRRNAARGGASAGVNSTLERIQQEQGRQSAEAAQGTEMGVLAANRQAQIAAANARLNQESDVSRQAGGLLANFPEFTSRTNEQTTREETRQGEQTTLPTTPGGGRVSGGGTVGRGGGVGYVKPSGGPAPSTLTPKRKPGGGLIPMLP